jgi:uncharacterized lipoprotein YddW (UPF0748 family)
MAQRNLHVLSHKALVGLLASLAIPAFAQSPDSAGTSPALSDPPDAASHAASDPAATAPDDQTVREMRGLWVVRDSLTSPDAVHQVVVTAIKYNLNALFVQVRGRGDAFYNSPYEPRAEDLAYQPKDFDPLQQIVTEAHQNGLQVHAWLNTYLTWSGSRRPYSPQHLWNAHRDWFACDRYGRCSPVPTEASEGAYLQPSNPAVQAHLFNVYTDVATRYDVDGIHFDYCRYCGTGFDFSASTLGRFRAYMQEQLSPDEWKRFDGRLSGDRLAYVHAFTGQWADWRRAQITNLVARISSAVKTLKPWLEVSAAVFPDADEAFQERGQDWAGWLRAGYLDSVALMAYDSNTERVLAQTRRAVAEAGGKYIYTGIGAWHLSAHDVARKIAEVRKAGAAGVNLFSYGGVHNRPQYLDTLARGVFASRAAPPRSRRSSGRSGPANRSPDSPPAAASSNSSPTETKMF